MPDKTDTHSKNWFLYMILCSDDSLYTGITTDVERRFRQHADGFGAKYFRGRQPLRIVYMEDGHNRSSASSREYQIKQMTKAEKQLLHLSTDDSITRRA
ncbi:MAG TPA: GIY-YIG nuclease family protein [Desulfuromonadales bacterium]|nr:GIY-YIG nuclease family protein [Desulfuromonadales bacterium]